jgi:hypothetical protein
MLVQKLSAPRFTRSGIARSESRMTWPIYGCPKIVRDRAEFRLRQTL